LEVSLLNEFLKLEELINEPSHDEDKALNFPDELIGKIDVLHLIFFAFDDAIGLIILLIQLSLPYNLQLFGLLLEHLYDIGFILNPLIIFFGFYIFSV
jgi:hypothetical protein